MKKFYLWTLSILFISWLLYGFLKELAFYTDEFIKGIRDFLALIGWLSIALGVGWFCEHAVPSNGKHAFIGFLLVFIGLPIILVLLIVISKNILF